MDFVRWISIPSPFENSLVPFIFTSIYVCFSYASWIGFYWLVPHGGRNIFSYPFNLGSEYISLVWCKKSFWCLGIASESFCHIPSLPDAIAGSYGLNEILPFVLAKNINCTYISVWINLRSAISFWTKF